MPWIEAVWIGSSLVGLFLAILGIIEARRDQAALRPFPRNGRHLIADQQLARYILRVVIFSAWLAALFVRDLTVELLIVANIALAGATGSDIYVGAMLRRIYRLKLGKESTDHE